jgi:HEAT repeat protein
MADAILPKAIRDPDPEIRAAALEVLTAKPGQRSAALLSQALRDGQETIREAAAIALGQYRGTLVADRLRSALQDPHPRVRSAAAQGLGQTRTPGFSEALEETLGDAQARVRAAAAEALGSIGRPEARQLLNRLAAQDPNPGNRQIAAQAIQQLDIRFATAEEKQRRSRLDAIDTLADADLARDKREQAKAYLNRVRDETLLPDLDAALVEAREDRVREDLMDVLAALPPSRQLQVRLVQYLHHPSTTVRRRAMAVLGEVGDRDALDFLPSVVQDAEAGELLDAEDVRLSQLTIAKIKWRAERQKPGTGLVS